MKLYVYEHCPFCIKARMIFGFKNIDFELNYLLNDEEKFLLDLVGVKMLPVLEKDDGTAMTESLDIIHYIDHLDTPKVITGPQNPEIKEWLSSNLGRVWFTLAKAYYVLTDFPEFETQEAIDYFTRKKDMDPNETFSDIRQNRAKYVAEINASMVDLAPLIKSKEAVNGELSLDDFHLFATLRNMTLLQDIEFPTVVLQYIQTISQLSGVPLLSETSLSSKFSNK